MGKLSRVALCVALMSYTPAWSSQTQPRIGLPIEVELHGSRVLLDGQLIGDYFALQQKCVVIRNDVAGRPANLASGIDTSKPVVQKIARILKQRCGVSYVAYVVIVYLNRKAARQ